MQPTPRIQLLLRQRIAFAQKNKLQEKMKDVKKQRRTEKEQKKRTKPTQEQPTQAPHQLHPAQGPLQMHPAKMPFGSWTDEGKPKPEKPPCQQGENSLFQCSLEELFDRRICDSAEERSPSPEEVQHLAHFCAGGALSRGRGHLHVPDALGAS